VNLLRRHPVAIVLVVLLLATAIHPLSPLVDAVTGSVPGDADLDRPILYVMFAPLSNTLDGLTFFSLPRAVWALIVWMLLLAAWGAVRASSDSHNWRRVVATSLLGPAVLIVLAVAALVLPRPVPRLVHDGPGTAIDYHAHTNASHDGRPGWTLAKLAAWHERQGFEASYVTDHNIVYDGSLPSRRGHPSVCCRASNGACHQQHVVAIGPVEALPARQLPGEHRADDTDFRRDRTPGRTRHRLASRVLALPLGRSRRVRAGGRGRLRDRELRAEGPGFPSDLRRQVVAGGEPRSDGCRRE